MTINSGSRNRLRPGFVLIRTHQADIVAKNLHQSKQAGLSTLALRQPCVCTVEMMSLNHHNQTSLIVSLMSLCMPDATMSA